MIQQLAILPLIPEVLVDVSFGTIQYNVPASNVQISSGTLVPDIVVRTAGTVVDSLTQVDPYESFDWRKYSERDLQLLGRDHIVAAATVKVAATAAMVFGTRVDRPTQLDLTSTVLPANSLDTGWIVPPNGTVQMVVPSSVPFDAIRSDQDLYGRDLILHEALARTSAIFSNPPIASSGTSVGTIGDTWSYADANPVTHGINPVLRLDVDLFKSPDRSLAFNDNGLGVYVAHISNFLKNPFVKAEQLLISVASTGTLSMEPEVYVHDDSQDTVSTRTWTAEPKLDGRFKIVYHNDTGLLRWYPPDSNIIHIPQSQPFVDDGTSISGPQGSQISFVVDTMDRKDSAFYAYKATQIITQNRVLSQQCLLSGAYSAGIDQGNLVQNVQTTLSNSVRLESIPPLPASTVYVGLTLIPQSFYEILGCQFPQLTADSDSGGLFPAGTSTTAQYPIGLLAGNYQLEITYTNSGGDTPADFPVYISFGGSIVTSSPLVFGSNGHVDGDAVTQAFNVLSNGTSGDIIILWAGPVTSTSQLKILRVRVVSSDTSALSLRLSAQLLDSNSVIDSTTFEFNGLRNRPDCVVLKFDVPAPMVNTNIVVGLVKNANLVALAINQVQVAIYQNLTPTPNADGYSGYPMSMLARAFDCVADSFNAIPDYADPRSSGSWTPGSTQSWLSQIALQESRIYSAFRVGGPLDVGRPALVPNGVGYSVATGTISASSADTRPELLSATAWMLTQRFLVAEDSFLGQGPTVAAAVGCTPVTDVTIYTGGALDPAVGQWNAVGGSLTQVGNDVHADGSITLLSLDGYSPFPGLPLDGTFDLTPIGSCLTVFYLNYVALGSVDYIGVVPNLYSLTVLFNPAITSFTMGSNFPACIDVELFQCDNLSSVSVAGNPQLVTLHLEQVGFGPLTTLDVTGCTGLTGVYATGCTLDQASVNNLLVTLDNSGLSGGTVNITFGTSPAPNGAGATAKTNLIGKGWSVSTN